MKKTILVWGLIAGILMVCLQWVIYPLCHRGYISPDNSYLGYAVMIICFSIIFFGIRSYRDNQGNGSITFWKGVQIGLAITLVASVIQALGWYFYNLVNPEFREFFVQKYAEARMSGLPDPTNQDAVELIEDEIGMLRTIYAKPLLEFVVTTVAVLPVGIVVTLISAAILRRQKHEP
jgi:hypothetical protein